LVEDCNRDAELIGAALQLGGMDGAVRRAWTEAGFRSALLERVPDIILSDYSLPQFNGLRSLEIAREMCPGTPFILISGTMTDGQAAEVLKVGATDYVLKHHMERLVPCVQRALREAEVLRGRRHTEAALRESEARQRCLLAGSPGIIYSCALRPEIRHTYVSGNVEAQLGYTPTEFLADANFWRDRLHPADAPHVFDGLSLLFERGRHTEEYRFLHNDGTWRWMRDEMRLISNETGKQVEIIGCCVDVTERKAAETEAERRIREQAHLIDIATDAITVCDLEGRITFWNAGAERIYGWTATEAVGRRCAELLGTSIEELERASRHVRDKGAWSGELSQKNKRGEEITVLVRFTLVRGGADRPTGVLGIGTDITERKKLEAQHLRAQRIEGISSVASGIAHDLNNALSPIFMGVSVLRLPEVRPSDRGEAFKMIESSARRGADIARQLLTFARSSEGQWVNLDLRHAFKETERICKRRLTRCCSILRSTRAMPCPRAAPSPSARRTSILTTPIAQ
ncbi:MAG: PAS domain S-box protein, partial [Verrucomicrobia bacterium]|nr:PAS domain S-box protein [Verrucomicrobiota bacterium]